MKNCPYKLTAGRLRTTFGCSAVPRSWQWPNNGNRHWSYIRSADRCCDVRGPVQYISQIGYSTHDRLTKQIQLRMSCCRMQSCMFYDTQSRIHHMVINEVYPGKENTVQQFIEQNTFNSMMKYVVSLITDLVHLILRGVMNRSAAPTSNIGSRTVQKLFHHRLKPFVVILPSF